VNAFMNIQIRIMAAQAQRMLQQLQRQIGQLNFGNAARGAGLFGGALGGMHLDRVGSQMQWLGRQIEYNFTVPLVAAGTAATKMALANEAAFTRITKVYGDAAHGADFYHAEIDSLRKAFVALSNQFGITQEDTLNIAADWAAAGASGLALAKSVQLTMKTMVLGELDAATATQSLIAIQAQYGQSIDQLGSTIAILNMVENQTGISMKGLIEGFTRAAGVARASGVSVRELAADLAALTPATGSAANAGNALKTIFSRMISPTKDTAEVLNLMGLNTRAMAWQSASAQEKLLLMARSFDKLSDAQKGFVSSIIASRYQVNRFEVLMRELISSNGYYQRALQSTADMTAVYNQAQKELNAVLTSNPQRLKIIWTTLQNAMADVIQPLIPMILWLAQSLMNLANWFSNLNPGVQKFVLLSLALLAAIGPVVRYLGAIQVLVFELVGALRFLVVPFNLLIGAFRILVMLPVGLFFNGLSLAIRGMAVAAVAVWPLIQRAFAIGLVGVRAVLNVGMIVVSNLWTRWLLALGNITTFATRLITAIWAAFTVGLGYIAGAAWGNITRIWNAGVRSVVTLMSAFAAFSGRIWALITYNPLVLVRQMWTGIIGLFTRAIPTLRIASTAVFTAMTGPWGLAITAVVALILIFWKDIKQIFTNGVNFLRGNTRAAGNAFKPLGDAANAVRNVVIRAFNALPNGIQRALLAVVHTVQAAAKAVYSWFSYINPWARHSPSLVDNVTSGVAEIKRQYDSLTGVGSAFANAGKDLKLFADGIRSVNRSVEQNKYNEIRKDLMNLAKDAVGPFDRLLKELATLQSQLVGVGSALDAQKSVVDGLKNNLDAANDALSAQKDIMDQMKQSADDYSDTLSRINGDIEVLQGTRKALREAGAGSDILGPMDEQLNKLKDQKKGINDQMTAAQKAYNEQKKLVDDLTAARDKLQASYDLEKQKLDAIQDAYDKIHDRIEAITSAIQDFASAADTLKQASGKTDDTAANFAAGAGANFADVGGSGGLGREGGIGDQASAIDDFTKQIQDETKKLFGMFDFLSPIKKAWNAAWGWIKTTLGPLAGFLGQWFMSLFKGINNPLDGINFDGWFDGVKSLGDAVVGFFQAVWRLIGPPIKEIGKVFQDAFERAMDKIGPALAKFKDLWVPIQKLWLEIVPVLKVLGAIIGGVLLLAFNIIINVLKEALGPILNWIIDIITAVIDILRGLITFVVGVFTGDWSMAWEGIKTVWKGVWDAIWSTLKNAVLLLWGIIKGLVEGIVGFFEWVYDELVGHSIIPDLVNAIVDWFKKMWSWVVDIWNGFIGALKSIWENVLKPVFEAIKSAWQSVGDLIRVVVDAIKATWEDFKNRLRSVNDWVRDQVNAIKAKWDEMKTIFSVVIGIVKGYIDDFVNKITGIRDRIRNAFGGMFDGLKDAFKSAVNWIIDKWNGLHFGVGPFSMDTPNMPKLAKGGKTDGVAIVGEGRAGYPEYVIPTDPAYRKRAWALFEQLGGDLGVNSILKSAGIMNALGNRITRGTGDKIQFFASGGILGRGSIRGMTRGGGVIVLASQDGNTYHFHGDLSFPNIKNGNDAQEFIKNLKALVGA
jgi:TP901 family phage tail tape measure protein